MNLDDAGFLISYISCSSLSARPKEKTGETVTQGGLE